MKERNETELTLDEESQLVLSYELLTLLHWLATRNPDALKRLVSYAFDSGLQQELHSAAHHATQVSSDDMHEIVSDFFGMLEVMLVEKIDEQAQARARANNLAPMIERIDTASCGDDTLLDSIKNANSQLEQNPQANARELLMKELLRQWKPRSKKASH